ncbi:COG3747 Phage terminase, small subunit [uncultured Caudovirales phage]|uniref:COG3747 Phage terminase, small subunit n=1 Tax=uncultured Caudovirales phage TaxID=2100421 RepID=A0A6J5RXZ0_9CAUD|nr:COG3747 Phage terminase, small subunit [uncultured Caudovirales phage]
MRGPKPKPVEQKIREGNPGKRPLPEPLLVGGRPALSELDEPPAHLPPEAQEFWRDSVKRLVEVGVVDRVDVPVLEQLATQYARIRQAQRVLAADGHFVRGSVGQLREHPAMKIERDATSLFLKIAEHYALTPIARTRLGLAELHRRSLGQEMGDALGTPNLRPKTVVHVNI